MFDLSQESTKPAVFAEEKLSEKARAAFSVVRNVWDRGNAGLLTTLLEARRYLHEGSGYSVDRLLTLPGGSPIISAGNNLLADPYIHKLTQPDSCSFPGPTFVTPENANHVKLIKNLYPRYNRLEWAIFLRGVTGDFEQFSIDSEPSTEMIQNALVVGERLGSVTFGKQYLPLPAGVERKGLTTFKYSLWCESVSGLEILPFGLESYSWALSESHRKGELTGAMIHKVAAQAAAVHQATCDLAGLEEPVPFTYKPANFCPSNWFELGSMPASSIQDLGTILLSTASFFDEYIQPKYDPQGYCTHMKDVALWEYLSSKCYF